MIPFYIWAEAVQVPTIVVAEGELVPSTSPITTTTASTETLTNDGDAARFNERDVPSA
jgi:hypothetical protein